MGKTDPRILKTRRKLKTSFLTLLATHRLSEINIKELTQTAEITRGTFYLHYKDKESYIHAMMLELTNECFEEVIYPSNYREENTVPIFSLVDFLKYVAERPSFFRALLKESEATEYHLYFIEQLSSYMSQHQEISKIRKYQHIPKELIVSFLSYSILGYVVNWIENGQIYTYHYMAENLDKLLDSELLREVGLDKFFVLSGAETVSKFEPQEV